MSCLFNSYDPYFKQPFGALRAGQTVRLTLCIPEELGYVDPHLVLQKEGKYDVPVHYRMKFDGQTPQQNHFSVELPLNDPGLYFYYFDLYTDFRRIYRGPDNCGVVSWQEGEKWQITVYDAGFQTPECIKGKVFYQIFPDRFCEGIENKPMPFPDRLYQADKHAEPFWQPNETGGHLNEDYFGGDLEGIRIKLPYLREMGVDYCWVSVKQFSKNDTATACQDWLRSTRLGRGSIKSHVRTVKVLGMGLFAFQERVHLWKGVTH